MKRLSKDRVAVKVKARNKEAPRSSTKARTTPAAPASKPARVKTPRSARQAKTRAPATVAPESPKGPALYDRNAIIDAPEHHRLAQAFGTLTWTTWDADVRPLALRVDDFVAAFPPDEPHRFVGGSRVRDEHGTFQSGDAPSRAARFLATDGRTGSLHELLARYGLRLKDAPPLSARAFTPDPFRETARRRNHKLRVLHGGVDIESGNMDEKKAAYLDSQEKQQAAQEVRAAIRRVREDAKGGNATKTGDGEP